MTATETPTGACRSVPAAPSSCPVRDGPGLDPVSAAMQAVVIRGGRPEPEGQPQGSEQRLHPTPSRQRVLSARTAAPASRDHRPHRVGGGAGHLRSDRAADAAVRGAGVRSVEPDRLHVQRADLGTEPRAIWSRSRRTARKSRRPRDDHLVQHGAGDVLGGQPAELPGAGRQGVGVRLRPGRDRLVDLNTIRRRRSGPVGQPAGRCADEVQRHRRRGCRR